MKEITCPNCKRTQRIDKNSFCSYCFFNLKENKVLDKKQTFPVDLNNLKDDEIVSILKIEQIKYTPNKILVIAFFVFLSLISFCIFIIEKRMFPITKAFGFIEEFALILSLVTSFYSYKYLSKKFNLDDLINEMTPSTYRGVQASFFERKIQFFLSLFFINILFIFLNIYALNDITSIIFPMTKYDIFINAKTSVRVKGGYNYYLIVTNWEKNKELEVKLQANQEAWDKITDQAKAQIKIKRGLLDSVIWGMKQ